MRSPSIWNTVLFYHAQNILRSSSIYKEIYGWKYSSKQHKINADWEKCMKGGDYWIDDENLNEMLPTPPCPDFRSRVSWKPKLGVEID